MQKGDVSGGLVRGSDAEIACQRGSIKEPPLQYWRKGAQSRKRVQGYTHIFPAADRAAPAPASESVGLRHCLSTAGGGHGGHADT